MWGVVFHCLRSFFFLFKSPYYASSGIAGNECAKHSASHDGGHDVHFQPPAPDGNAYTHLYWLAAKDTDEEPSKGRGAILPILHALSDLKAKPKTEMCKLHRLGVPKQTQSITATGRTSDCWARSQLQMLSEP
jgi:hypothetical protein